LLLAAVDPVGKLVIRDHMIKLCCRLVVPTAPGLAAVHGHTGPLIAGQENDVGVVRINPEGVRVVASGGSLESGEGLAAVAGAVGTGVRHVDDILVLRINLDLGEVGTPAPDALLAVDMLP